MIYLILFLVGTCSGIAFGQEEAAILVESKSFLEQLGDGSFLAKLVAFGIGCQMILYGISSGLMVIAQKTETSTDNKIASWLGQAAWILGAFLGKFGYSVPKAILEEKAKSLNEQPNKKAD